VRIAFLITELDPGGAERALTNLACGLKQRGHDCLAVSLKPLPQQSNRTLVDRLTEHEIPVQSLNIRNPLGFLTASRKLRRLLQSEGTEIVQSFLHHANILSARSATLASVPQRVAGYRVSDPSPWRNWLERRHLSRWDHIVPVSEDVSIDLQRRIEIDKSRISVIPNGVDLGQFADVVATPREQLGISTDRRLLLFAGRLHPQKGLDRLLPHLPQLFTRLPEHQLLIVGDGPQRSQLEKLSAKHDLTTRIHFLGHREDLPNLMAASECLLLPSYWEGMPNVLLEAMAMGMPASCFSAHGVIQLLDTASAEQVSEIGDFKTFCNKLTDIVTTPDLALRLGAANRSGSARYSIDSMVDSYEAVYQQLLS
jgi:starch synthase (maltosyl-transferring)